jgi:cytochrome c-type biogenesis protein CcmH
MVAAEIEETAKKLGRDPATLPGRKPVPPAPAATAAGNGAAAPNQTTTAPSAEDIAKAAAMTPEQRAAFIDSMVKGLADRQKAHPEDIDGWLRLANAYDKLGRADDAFTAWHEAATRAPDRLDTQIAYAAAGAVRAERGAPPADFEATVARLRQLAPDNPLGLYCAGLIAEAHGDKTAAKGFWQKLLPVLPEGSPQRQQIEARIAKLGN